MPPLAEQVEAWVSALLAPRPLRAENALALARHALHPVDASVALELAWGEGRTHLAPRWAPQALCGASLGASGTRGVAVTCGTCAGLLPPEAD